MDYRFQSGNYNNSVPNYYLYVPSAQNPSSVQQSSIIRKQCENWYFVYPEDMQAVRCTDGSIRYQIVSLFAPVACENCVIMQPNPYVASEPIVEHYNFHQQIAIKQLELKILETQLQEEATRHLPPYQLVFHNDAATSTTDLTYYTQPWRNNCSNMLKANAYAQLHKPCSSDMQVDQNYRPDYFKLTQDNPLMKHQGKAPVRVQFSDIVTIFYNHQNSDCSRNSVIEEMMIDQISEKIDDTEYGASTSHQYKKCRE